MAYTFTLRCSTCHRTFAAVCVEAGTYSLFETAEYRLPCHPIGESTGLEVTAVGTDPFDRICELFGIRDRELGAHVVFKIRDSKKIWFMSARA